MDKLGQIASCLCAIVLIGCVTRTINSDGTVQNNVIDKAKLSDTYVDLAIEYQSHNAPQIALDRANLAITTEPDNARAYMVRGMIYASLNKPQDAEVDFKQALKRKDDYAEAQVNYAVFLCNLQRYPEAMQNFATALNNPLYFTPELGYYNRGNCYFSQVQLESANADYLKALSARNAPADTYIALARLQFLNKNYQLANYYINKFPGNQTPATFWLHVQILQALIDNTNDKERLREYTSYRNTIGKLLIQNYGDTSEAQQYLLQYPAVPSQTAPAAAKTSAAPAPIVVKMAPVTVKPAKFDRVLRDQHQRRYIIVTSGDTLYHISREFKISEAALIKINHLGSAGPRLGLRIYLDPPRKP